MSYEAHVEADGCIRVAIHDELTPADIDKAMQEILTARKEHGATKILCDQRDMKVPPSEIVVFETAKRFSGDAFSDMKLAILRNSIPEDHLFETVARNRTALARVFDDEGKARLWLNANNMRHTGTPRS